ncbi:MAG: hypothetical protein P8Y83_02955 [Gammaproteobacteria bacterium]
MMRILFMALLLAFAFPAVASSEGDAEKAAEAATEQAKEAATEAAAEGEKKPARISGQAYFSNPRR